MKKFFTVTSLPKSNKSLCNFSFRVLLSAVLLPMVAMLFSGNIQAQTTIVNYDFNTGASFAALTPTLASGITCAPSSSRVFATGVGTNTTGSFYTNNITAGNALNMANATGNLTNYFQFDLGGSSLNLYKTFNVYFQGTKGTATAPASMEVQYSLNGGAYTGFASNVLTLSATLNAFLPVNMSLLSAVDNPTTSISIRIFVNGATLASAAARIDNFQVQATVTPNAITTGTIATTSFCSGASVSVPFTYIPIGGFPNGTAVFTAELSDITGNFPGTDLSPNLISNASGSQTITATIPSAFASGAAYKIRVKSASPAVTGVASATTITVANSITSIAPVSTQNIPYSTNGTSLTVTEGSAASSRQWAYGTISGGPYSTNVGTGVTTFTPNFPIVGTYYVVCKTIYPNCTITSNEVQINVTGVAATISSPTVTGISNNSATLGANVTSTGGYGSIIRGTSFKVGAGVLATDNPLAEGGTTTGIYSHPRTLFPETFYSYLGYVTNGIGTVSTSSGNFYTWSNPATVQAANLLATTVSISQIDVSWDAAVFPGTGATVKGYVLLRATAPSTPSFTAANGTVPAGTGTIVSSAIIDPTISFSNTGLASSTTYNYLLVPYTWDGANAATYNYLTAAAITATATTLTPPCTPPATQATAATISGATAGTLNISWTAVGGTNSFVIVRAGAAVNQAPVVGTPYSSSTVFASGANLGSANFVCFNAAGSSFTLTGLTSSTTYYVSVYSYNTSGTCFNLTSPATTSGLTLPPPTVIETFELGTKGSYTTGNDVCNLGTWNFNNALIGQLAGDAKNGAKSARIQGTGSITMQFDKYNGLGTVSVKHALYSGDIATSWRMDVSDDGGATFAAYSSPITSTTLYSLSTATFTPNLTGNQIRIRIVKLSGGSGDRLNIDDINLGDYVSTNTISGGAITGAPFCITDVTGTAVNVPFTSGGIFNTGNVYTALLSDATGSFTTPTDIGTLTSTANTGTISATIPAGTVTGSNYKIRVIASNPVVVGTPSATIFSINLNTPEVTGVNASSSSGAIAVSWTNPIGCFTEMVVFASTSSISCVPTGNGSAYTASATFGSGTACGSSFVVYKGAATTSGNITGLTNGVTYYFKVFVRNGTNWSTGVQITAVPSVAVDGDYQTHQTGAYNSVNTWEKRVSGSWVWPSPDLPGTGNAGTANVTILAPYVVNMSSSASTSAIKTLTVNTGATLYGSSASNTYITLYGDVVCNGTIGLGAATWNSLGINVEGPNCTFSGTGTFNISRLRKNYAANLVTNLIIAMNVNLLWNTSSGTTMYNAISTTTFNVTVNQNASLSAINLVSGTGNMAINGTNGLSGDRAGTYTINGTMNIPGIIYATSNNTNAGRSCNWIIGNTGIVNCNQINADASGLGGHNFTILNGGRLNINTNVGFNTSTATSFSPTNNTFDLQPGSIVEYSATTGVTHILTDLTYSNLVVSGSGTKDFIDRNLSQTGPTLNVNRNLTISGTSILTPANPGNSNPSNAINVGGNWNNYGTAGFSEAFSTVTFNGAAAQKINCPGGDNFYNITVSNASTLGVELNADISVANNLDLGSTGRLFFGVTPSIVRLTNMANASNSFLGSGAALVDMSQSASSLYIGCQSPGYSGTFSAGNTSLVSYNRDAAVSLTSGTQNVLTTINYANLSLSGSDAKNVNNDFTVNGKLTVDGSSTALEITAASKTLTLGGGITLSGGGTMGGVTGTSCLNNLSIVTAAASAALTQTFNGDFNPINCFDLSSTKTANGIVLTATNTNLTITNNLTQVTAAQLSPNDNRVKIGNVWTIWGSGALVAGTSTVEYTGTVAQTIAGVNYYNLESSSTGNRTMSTSSTVGIGNIFTKGTNLYSFTGSTVNYNGSVDQSVITFTANATIVGRTYDNLSLSTSGNKSLLASTDVEGALTLNNSVALVLGTNFLNLKSTATQTARVAPVSATASITYGTGKFVIERYYPARRAWRLITAPVTVDGTKSIFNAWQVGSDNLVSGSGTYVTGPGPTTANGLDASPLNNSSLKTFNPATSQFESVINTKTALISGVTGTATVPDNFGYFMFVRGDRTASNVNAFYAYGAVLETTLRDTGKIQLQSYTFPAVATIAANRYTLIGNPYASPVDFASLTRNNVANKFIAWDPKLNAVGGYVTVDLSSGVTITVPVGTVGSTTQTQIIQSKQAFIIETSAASSPSLVFNEAAKSATNNLTMFRPQGSLNAFVAVNLHVLDSSGNAVLADGVLAQFGNEYSNDVDQFDALKFGNVNETFSIASNNNNYMLHRRQPLVENDTIFLNLKKSRQLKYRLNFIFDKMTGQNSAAYLEDIFLQTSQQLNMNGSAWVDFEINGNAASANANRFRIVFKKAINLSGIKAVVVNSDIAVDWFVKNENTVSRYELERSVNGQNFSTIATKQAVNASNSSLETYNWLDEKPAAGIYYYRVKGISAFGEIAYSETVKVKIAKSSLQLYVYPNPVANGNIGLQMTKMPAGIYSIKLMNTAGQVVYKNQFIHQAETATENIDYPNSISKGTYNLELLSPDKKRSVIKIFIQ